VLEVELAEDWASRSVDILLVAGIFAAKALVALGGLDFLIL
jgi:hypothetical protein